MATSAKVTFAKAKEVLCGLGCTVAGDSFDGEVLGPDDALVASGYMFEAVLEAYQVLTGRDVTLKRAKSPRAYAKEGGKECPMCLCIEIEGDSVEIEAGGAYQRITCNECGWAWVDAYELTGYSESSPY